MKDEAQAFSKVCFSGLSQCIESDRWVCTGEAEEAPPTGTHSVRTTTWDHPIRAWPFLQHNFIHMQEFPQESSHHHQSGQKGKTFPSQRENEKCSAHSLSISMSFVHSTSCCARNSKTCRPNAIRCVCVCVEAGHETIMSSILTFWPPHSQTSSASISNGNRQHHHCHMLH